MKILVSNIGSTSFKFRLFETVRHGQAVPVADGPDLCELASGGADRIGSTGGALTLRVGGQDAVNESRDFADHGEAIRVVLEKLSAGGVLAGPVEPGGRFGLDAVAFKAVLAGDVEPVALVDDELLAAMERYAPVAPAHNPPYIAAMRMFREAIPHVPLVAAFESGFHRTNPPGRRVYACPPQWTADYGVKRYGFHGASHRYIAERTRRLMGDAAGRIISCHLGGSSSLCAIREGRSQAVSHGLSPQSGLPQAGRCGEFDPFALALLCEGGLSVEQVLDGLASEGGLAGLSGTSGDMRDLRAAEAGGDGRAALAIDVFVTSLRDYLGAYLVELGGADAIVFTGGIGQRDPALRAAALRGLEFAGIRVDAGKNDALDGEFRFDADGSATALWVMPTNEELIVARQAVELLTAQASTKTKDLNE